MTTKTTLGSLIIVTLATFSAGCDKQQSPSNSSGSQQTNSSSSSLPSGLFATVEPTGAKSVEEVKASAKVGDLVVVRGRVGGSAAPFVEGRAVFTLMGNGLKACSDNPEDKCTVPWDYCCETAEDIAKHSATIQVLSPSGTPVKTSIRGQEGIRELSELVISGKLVQASDKVTIIAADTIYAGKR